MAKNNHNKKHINNKNTKETFKQKVLKRKKLIIVISIVAIVGFIFLRVRAAKKDEAETTEIKRGTVTEELILSGEIQADEHAELPFLSSGELDWIGISEGEEVKRGQVLARLDTANLYASYESAISDLRSAQATLDRVYDEVKGHEEDETFEQKEDRTTAEVARDKAYRALTIAQKNLANATLRAPFDGIVSAITNPFSGIGTIYTQSQIEVVNPETIYFEVSADQTEVIDLAVGQKARIVLDSFIDQEFDGEVKFISYTPIAGEVGAVYKVKVGFSIDQFDVKRLRIGMTGDAKFILSEKSDVLYLPPQFVNSNTKGKFVNLRRKNNRVYIDVGLEGEERVEVEGEIKEGDEVFD